MVFADSDFSRQAVYAFIESSVGVGNLVGGFVIGLVGARLPRAG